MGVIVQQLGGQVLPEEVPLLVEAGATHFLIAVHWAHFEQERGRYDDGAEAPLIRAVIEAGALPILRLMWPVPEWAPSEWAAQNGYGQNSFNRRAFLVYGRVPSIFADEAWEAVYRAQDRLAALWPEAEVSPPGGGGGEWSHATTHFIDDPEGRNMAEIAHTPWCFCPSALAKWERAYRAGEVGAPEPPRTFPEVWKVRGFTRWYLEALRGRLRQAIRRAPAKPWVALIPRPGYGRAPLCAGLHGLEEVAIQERAAVIVHCLFGRGNDDEQRAFVLDTLPRFRESAVGVEGWRGLAANSPTLARAGCSHLLVGANELSTAGIEQFAFWSAWWRRRQP